MKCGIVGPGRTRNGLAPFLASFLEQAGCRVVAGAGREPERSRTACEALAARLGHDVAAFDDVRAMVESQDLDALIVAAPVPAHLPALRIALEAGLHVLSEKPLVREAELGEVPALLDGFRDRGLTIMENCQWPETLPVFDEFWPGLRHAEPGDFALGLAPSGRGRAMLEDSLPHFLSVAQALFPVGSTTAVQGVSIEGMEESAERCTLRAELVNPDGRRLRGRLELRRVKEQPRPAFVEVRGRRLDRQVRLPDYALAFTAPDGRSATVEDPLARLVYRFALFATRPDRDRVRAEADQIRERARLYGEILRAWPVGA